MKAGHETYEELAALHNGQIELNNPERPIIAYCPDWIYDPDSHKLCLDCPTLHHLCHEALTIAGGQLYLLSYFDTPEEILKKKSIRFDGMMIPGGRDIDPKFYYELNHGSRVDEKDSELWWNFNRKWVDHLDPKVPIFGICYGMQVLNCLFGGKMIQDIDTIQNHRRHTKMTYKEGSFLDDALNGVPPESSPSRKSQKNFTRFKELKEKNLIIGNCYHHQACKNIPSCFDVVAWDNKDLIPHAIEYNKPDRKILAVQWHPEYTHSDGRGERLDPSNERLFRYFTDLCREYARHKTHILTSASIDQQQCHNRLQHHHDHHPKEGNEK